MGTEPAPIQIVISFLMNQVALRHNFAIPPNTERNWSFAMGHSCPTERLSLFIASKDKFDSAIRAMPRDQYLLR